MRTLIRDLINKTVKRFGNLVSFYSVLYCAPGSNVKVGRGTSRKVEKRFVAPTTYGTYSENIFLVMLCLFDTRREFLVQEYIPKFEAMNHEDLLDFQRREEDENMTSRGKRHKNNERTVIQNMIEAAI